jgi:hypothetical protein
LAAQGLGSLCVRARAARMLESVMEVIWDLLVFLALVLVGLVVLNLLARAR